MDHFFFVDDSGSKNWETPYSKDFIENPPSRVNENKNFWRRNYFSLTGIHICNEKMSEINPLINKKKIEYFGTKYVEIKSEWFRNPHQRRKNYTTQFNITEESLTEFMEEFWYPLFQENKNSVKIQAFVLDKRYFAGKRIHTPIEILTQTLFDRVERYPAENCTIVFDQMEKAIKSEKGAQGKILKVSKKEVNIGSFYSQYTHADVRFEKSVNSNFLQMADTASYNVWRQFVDFGDSWDDPKETLKMYHYFEKISDNFFHSPTGQISGYGIIKHPNPARIKWSKNI